MSGVFDCGWGELDENRRPHSKEEHSFQAERLLKIVDAECRRRGFSVQVDRNVLLVALTHAVLALSGSEK